MAESFNWRNAAAESSAGGVECGGVVDGRFFNLIGVVGLRAGIQLIIGDEVVVPAQRIVPLSRGIAVDPQRSGPALVLDA